jgi:hypothetical protein
MNLKVGERRSLFSRLAGSTVRLAVPYRGQFPRSSEVPWECDLSRYDRVLERIQQLRGRVYVADGAIPAEALDEKGRHLSQLDDCGWHLYLLDDCGEVLGCVRINQYSYPAYIAQLNINCVLARIDGAAAAQMESGVLRLLDRARQKHRDVWEVGGLAVAPQAQGGIKGVIMACACWALAQWCGNMEVLATATIRHRAAEILCRMGGYPLPGISQATYYDPYHRCDVQLLSFNPFVCHADYQATISDVKQHLARVGVLTQR